MASAPTDTDHTIGDHLEEQSPSVKPEQHAPLATTDAPADEPMDEEEIKKKEEHEQKEVEEAKREAREALKKRLKEKKVQEKKIQFILGTCFIFETVGRTTSYNFFFLFHLKGIRIEIALDRMDREIKKSLRVEKTVSLKLTVFFRF